MKKLVTGNLPPKTDRPEAAHPRSTCDYNQVKFLTFDSCLNEPDAAMTVASPP
eukprot:CAMPEP_0172756088 /NCGR_PEP_ID=MMETSP1074-20121228/161133_1 /TAXON_ID=2916 /ORGANISM="Ceratium fusus, Strain PA161109" /LENGTH=52 /DNA_ID=CAMNT_0013589295 /DNA_START=360 /DNA_END=518 /DNA_ORIENTATION=-